MALGNQDRIRQWVDALRHGGYEQAQSALKDRIRTDDGEIVTGFCCLGVAAHLAAQDPDSGINERETGFNDESLMPPPEVSEWYGLEYDGLHGEPWRIPMPESIRDEEGNDPDATVALDSLNDTHRFTFAQIADVIEENYLEAK